MKASDWIIVIGTNVTLVGKRRAVSSGIPIDVLEPAYLLQANAQPQVVTNPLTRKEEIVGIQIIHTCVPILLMRSARKVYIPKDAAFLRVDELAEEDQKTILGRIEALEADLRQVDKMQQNMVEIATR